MEDQAAWAFARRQRPSKQPNSPCRPPEPPAVSTVRAEPGWDCPDDHAARGFAADHRAAVERPTGGGGLQQLQLARPRPAGLRDDHGLLARVAVLRRVSNARRRSRAFVSAAPCRLTLLATASSARSADRPPDRHTPS